MLTLNDVEKILRERKLLCAVTGTMQADETQVCWLTCDSRTVAPDTVFVCKGAAFRQKYLLDAEEQGCIAYISEIPYETQKDIRGWIVRDLQCRDIRMEHGKIMFSVVCDRFKETFTLGMKGKFNIENAMAAITAGYALGIPVSCMKEALATTYVPGRMETYFSGDGHVCGIVDFAHNRLSFENLFDAVYQEYPSYTKIITVFGCPGGKALNRRKELGTLAGLFSDFVYVTSDSPGTEHQEKIAAEVRRYVERGGCACECVPEREEAVRKAVLMAYGMKEKTLVLVLGRGSEKYQKIGKKTCSYPTDAYLLEEAMKIQGIPDK